MATTTNHLPIYVYVYLPIPHPYSIHITFAFQEQIYTISVKKSTCVYIIVGLLHFLFYSVCICVAIKCVST